MQDENQAFLYLVGLPDLRMNFWNFRFRIKYGDGESRMFIFSSEYFLTD